MSSGDLLPPEETTAEKPAKRGRPVGSTTRPKRRNYQTELAQLQGRVDQALFLLHRVRAESEMLAAAIETLERE